MIKRTAFTSDKSQSVTWFAMTSEPWVGLVRNLVIIGLVVRTQILEQFYLSPNIKSSKINKSYKTESSFNILSPSNKDICN